MSRSDAPLVAVTDAHMERLAAAKPPEEAPSGRPVVDLYSVGVLEFASHAQPLWELRDAGLLRSTGTLGILEMTEAGVAALAAWRIAREHFPRAA